MATRERQRARTRQAILEAATELLDAQTDVTIEAVVESSGISRATIYRYFESADDISWHALTDRATDDAEDVVVAAGADPLARVAAAERGVHDLLFSDADNVRRVVATTVARVLEGRAQDTDRPARRLRYIDTAIEPIVADLGEEAAFRLRHALAAVIGTEAFVALVDVCRIDADQARTVLGWATEALVRQAMAEAGIDAR